MLEERGLTLQPQKQIRTKQIYYKVGMSDFYREDIFTTGFAGYSSPDEERVLPLRLECLELLLQSCIGGE